MSRPVRLLAFIQPTGDGGPILTWEGGADVAEELAQAGRDAGDHNFPVPDGIRGLLIFEGWLEWERCDIEPESMFVGIWRRLSMWELSRVRFGLSPFVADKESA